MKTLYIHAGAPKTASSAIQKFCFDNAEILEKHGYCYPKFSWKYQVPPTKRNGLFLYKEVYGSDGRRMPEEEKRRFSEGCRILSELFEKYDHVILSDEILWHAFYKRKQTLWQEIREEGDKNGYQVKVIVYLRRQDQYIASWWNQIIKAGAKQPPNGYEVITWEKYSQNVPKAMHVDYYAALEKIAGALGRENVIVRRFQMQDFYGGTIQADFLHCMGLDLTEDFRVETEFANLKLSGNAPEIKRILNSLPNQTQKEKDFFKKTLKTCSPVFDEEYPCSPFSAKEAAEYVSRFEEGNRKVAEEYLGEPKGTPLFSGEYKETLKWEKDNPYMQDDVIRFVGETNRELLRRLEEQKKEIDRLQKELRNLKESFKHPLRTLLYMIKKSF